jgi:hypothetical protein
MLGIDKREIDELGKLRMQQITGLRANATHGWWDRRR